MGTEENSYLSQLSEELGTGLLGKTCRLNDNTNVVKIIDSNLCSSEDIKNSLKNYGFIEADDSMCLVRPYIEGFTLREMIDLNNKRDKQFPVADCRKMITQISESIKETHGNLKPTNIIFDDDGSVHLIDGEYINAFKKSAVLRKSSESECVKYADPELLAPGSNWCEKSDLFSLGIILKEMLYGQLPENTEAADSIRSDIPLHVLDTVNKATNTNPEVRYKSLKDFLAALSSEIKESSPQIEKPVKSTVQNPSDDKPQIADINQTKQKGKGGALLLVAIFLIALCSTPFWFRPVQELFRDKALKMQVQDLAAKAAYDFDKIKRLKKTFDIGEEIPEQKINEELDKAGSKYAAMKDEEALIEFKAASENISALLKKFHDEAGKILASQLTGTGNEIESTSKLEISISEILKEEKIWQEVKTAVNTKWNSFEKDPEFSNLLKEIKNNEDYLAANEQNKKLKSGIEERNQLLKNVNEYLDTLKPYCNSYSDWNVAMSKYMGSKWTAHESKREEFFKTLSSFNVDQLKEKITPLTKDLNDLYTDAKTVIEADVKLNDLEKIMDSKTVEIYYPTFTNDLQADKSKLKQFLSDGKTDEARSLLVILAKKVEDICRDPEALKTLKTFGMEPEGHVDQVTIDKRKVIGVFKDGFCNGKGLIYWSDKNYFIGNIKNNYADGNGIEYLENGAVYSGIFVKDTREGFGKITWTNGDIYEGEFKENYRTGKGKLTSTAGYLFEGEFLKNKVHGKGKEKYINGNSYEGEYVNGKREGHGVFKYKNGDTYTGAFKEDKFHGKGTYIGSDGFKYTGNWEHGSEHGKGDVQYVNGNSYSGDFSKGYKEGKGTFIWKNGSSYTGDFVKGKLTGKGKYRWTSGDSYEGDVSDGALDGEGIYQFKNGDKYVGKYVKDQRYGHGIYYYSNGDVYSGYWKNNKKEGPGKVKFKNGTVDSGTYKDGQITSGSTTFANGNKYTGSYTDGNLTGYGTYTFSGGGSYTGKVLNGQLHGNGTYYWTNGDKFVGDWKNGERTGYGTYYYSNGDKYVGNFFKGEKHGKGTYYYKNGTSRSGNWYNGKFTN